MTRLVIHLSNDIYRDDIFSDDAITVKRKVFVPVNYKGNFINKLAGEAEKITDTLYKVTYYSAEVYYFASTLSEEDIIRHVKKLRLERL